MIEPQPAYAALHSGLIGHPSGRVPAPLLAEEEAPTARWREDLRFFLSCYGIALAAFLLLLG